jgi:hypothetical protein
MNPIIVEAIASVIPPKVAVWLGLLFFALAYCLPRLWAVDAGQGDIIEHGYPLGLGLIMIGMRKPAVTAHPDGKRPDERGMARLGVLLVLTAMLGALGLLAGGCASADVVAKRTSDFAVERGPPCTILVYADGKLRYRQIGPERCNVTVDGVQP